MLMSYSVVQDGNLPPEIVKEMVGYRTESFYDIHKTNFMLLILFIVFQTSLVEFYKDMHDFIDFNKVFKGELTYLEKLKVWYGLCSRISNLFSVYHV